VPPEFKRRLRGVDASLLKSVHSMHPAAGGAGAGGAAGQSKLTPEQLMRMRAAASGIGFNFDASHAMTEDTADQFFGIPEGDEAGEEDVEAYYDESEHAASHGDKGQHRPVPASTQDRVAALHRPQGPVIGPAAEAYKVTDPQNTNPMNSEA
jgi:hypothetical protein